MKIVFVQNEVLSDFRAEVKRLQNKGYRISPGTMVASSYERNPYGVREMANQAKGNRYLVNFFAVELFKDD